MRGSSLFLKNKQLLTKKACIPACARMTSQEPHWLLSTTKKITLNVLLILLIIPSINAIEAKRASDVFKKWLTWQECFTPVNLADEQEKLAQQFSKNFKTVYEQYLPLLRTYHTPFLQKLTDSQVSEAGHQITDLRHENIRSTLTKLYVAAQNDMPTFINMLNNLSFNEHSLSIPQAFTQDVIDNSLRTNAALCSCIFGQDNQHSSVNTLKDTAILFEVANKFANFCFEPKTFPLFQEMLLQKKYRATAQFLFSTMHQRFSGSGWHNWSTQCLSDLKTASEEGKTVVYVAGGSDIYQLITHGIYNIKVIDPQLPSQPQYYADEWAWIIKGDIGDQIVFDTQNIIMTRTSYQEENKSFIARLEDGQEASINPSKTVWFIANIDGKKLGSYTLERRFVRQEDFKEAPDQALLMSFNELFFIALPDVLQGWHIEPSKFTDDLNIFIKQLHEPVTKAEVCNMRNASLLNATDFKFIPLGCRIN